MVFGAPNNLQQERAGWHGRHRRRSIALKWKFASRSIERQELAQEFSDGRYWAGIGAASNIHSPLAGWLTARVLNRFREAGMTRVDEVVRDAMLNPDLAYALLSKSNNGSSAGNSLARALRKVSVASAALASIGSGRTSPEPWPEPAL